MCVVTNLHHFFLYTGFSSLSHNDEMTLLVSSISLRCGLGLTLISYTVSAYVGWRVKKWESDEGAVYDGSSYILYLFFKCFFFFIFWMSRLRRFFTHGYWKQWNIYEHVFFFFKSAVSVWYFSISVHFDRESLQKNQAYLTWWVSLFFRTLVQFFLKKEMSLKLGMTGSEFFKFSVLLYSN